MFLSSFPLTTRDSWFSDYLTTGMMGLSITSTALALAGLALTYTICRIVYNVYFHPLSKYPGPRLNAAVRLPWALTVLRGDMATALRSLHDQYGEVVRFAPGEVSFITPSAWKEIYGHGSSKLFVKDRISYRNQPKSQQSLLGARDADHARCRKLLTHAFSDRALREQQELIKSYVDSLIDNLENRAAGGQNKETASPIDLVQWYNFTTFDLIGDLAFGSSFNCLKASSMHPWVALIFASIKAMVIFSVAQRYSPLHKILLFLASPTGKNEKQAYHLSMTKEKLQQRLETETDRPDFMTYILRHNDEKGMTIPELEANASLLIKAGSETTATALSGASYLLMRNPDKLARLVEEIRTTFASEDEMDVSSLSKCKYLDACLKESLRMYPPVPVGLPRKATEDTSVSGYHVPKGAIVQIPQWSIHYSSNFVEPHKFAPERWMSHDPSSPYANDHQEAFEPFSLGPRNCIGKNLAWLEMRLILARVLYVFDLELLDNTWDPELQKVYVLWQKPALNVRLTKRPRMQG